ncbi:Fic family protein [Luteipulveratus sp. YIM 133132]|uniref:Fic family protein n=1 Tax=Luteipulveratus flavus TaxID=3031728 RepID=UPI0023AEE9B4|nr:Fic family protein [Luteipulveratus sp. YIM 133132]MDE9366953.1 Fic family protein [Luteipulveratus sp. YIM 133132]
MSDPDVVESLRALQNLPGVAEAVDAARDACTELRWHQALRRRIPQAAAESRVRGARASAALEGAEVDVAVVRDLMRGALSWPDADDHVMRTLRSAVQATAETEHVRSLVGVSPAQALARLHVAAGAPLLDPEQVGRPRVGEEDSRELVEVGPAAPPAVVAERLRGLADVVGALDSAPALVVAAVAHGEIATLRPFVRGNGLVARAFERALLQQSGLDPTGVAVPELGHGREGATGYAGALAAYASGTTEGVALWLTHCAQAVRRGAQEGLAIADAVLAGRIS